MIGRVGVRGSPLLEEMTEAGRGPTLGWSCIIIETQRLSFPEIFQLHCEQIRVEDLTSETLKDLTTPKYSQIM